MDYEVERCSRHCAQSGRELLPGQPYYSVLIAEGSELKRRDYAAEAWQGPPAQCVGWWKAQVPDRQTTRKHWAPNEVMLQLFDELAEQPEKQDLRYVLALLLVRRRVMRLEEEKKDAAGQEEIVLFCPRRDATYSLPVVMPSAERAEQIQQELAALLA
jgi:hypothetical protein